MWRTLGFLMMGISGFVLLTGLVLRKPQIVLVGTIGAILSLFMTIA